MALVIFEDLLAPPAVGVVVSFEVASRLLLRLPQGTTTYQGSTVVQQRVVAADAAGYLMELTTLTQSAQSPSPLSDLLLDLVRVNSPLQVETDRQGNFRRIANKATLRTQWHELRPWLQAKYRALPGSAAMLAQLGEQYEPINERLEQALAHKGALAVLLPGVYGLRALAGEIGHSDKTIHQFYEGGALPVRVAWTATAAETFARTAEVVGVGELDAARFDLAGFQQSLSRLVAVPPARFPALRVQWQEQYTLSRTGQGLLAGRQWLRATVPGLYEHETEHILRLVPPPPSPSWP